MATLRQRTNGVWEIQFRDLHGRRKTITLGRKYRERTAQLLQNVVSVLVDKKINADPTVHKPTQTWVEKAPPEIQEKLARFDLWKPPV